MDTVQNAGFAARKSRRKPRRNLKEREFEWARIRMSENLNEREFEWARIRMSENSNEREIEWARIRMSENRLRGLRREFESGLNKVLTLHCEAKWLTPLNHDGHARRRWDFNGNLYQEERKGRRRTCVYYYSTCSWSRNVWIRLQMKWQRPSFRHAQCTPSASESAQGPTWGSMAFNVCTLPWSILVWFRRVRRRTKVAKPGR